MFPSFRRGTRTIVGGAFPYLICANNSCETGFKHFHKSFVNLVLNACNYSKQLQYCIVLGKSDCFH